MLKIHNLQVKLADDEKEILHGVSLEINAGEIIILNGKNGSGKSTLVNTIMGNPNFEITKGNIELVNEAPNEFIRSQIDPEEVKENGNYIEICSVEPNERSLLGIYLANQYPVEIPGVSLTHFLRLVYNSRRPKDKQLNIFKFKSLLKEKAAIIKYPEHLLTRNLNEGFSGGEKKKTEILQMLVLEPKYVMLDEVDSGLDKQSVKEVFEGLAAYKKSSPETAMIIISHYDKVLDYLKPDRIIEMENGNIKL